MAFWGIEVKPSKPFSHRFDTTRGRLKISQATLGIGSSSKNSLVQCNVGDKSPIFLCSLLPDKMESCFLNFEFEEEDEVIFSVLGPRSVHLAGFYLDKSRNANAASGDESDSYGEDIGETESDHSSDTEDEYEEDFIDDDDFQMFPRSPKPKTKVVIEELLDDEKPANGMNGDKKRLKKKRQASDSDSENQKLIPLSGGANIFDSDSEDEDPLPVCSLKDKSFEVREKPDKKVSKKSKKKDEDGGVQLVGTKRKSKDAQDGGTDSGDKKTNDMLSSEVGQESTEKRKKKKKKARSKEEKTRGVGDESMADVHKENKVSKEEANTDDIIQEEPVIDGANEKPNDKSMEADAKHVAGEDTTEKKKKKNKKNKNKAHDRKELS